MTRKSHDESVDDRKWSAAIRLTTAVGILEETIKLTGIWSEQTKAANDTVKKSRKEFERVRKL